MDGGEVGNVNPTTLPLTDALKADLFNWAQSYDRSLNTEYPPDSGFADTAAEMAFEVEGQRLWKELQRQLVSEFNVIYYSQRDHKLYE